MGFKLGRRSKDRLKGVHSDLVRVVERAIEVTGVDFTVLEGVRSPERQQELVSSGASQTLDSRHLTGHAVDLGALLGGKVSWDWSLYYRVAAAVQQAGQELEVPIRWGGAWDRELTGSNQAPQDMMNTYVMKRKLAGKRAFPDGPHFDLPKSEYPA